MDILFVPILIKYWYIFFAVLALLFILGIANKYTRKFSDSVNVKNSQLNRKEAYEILDTAYSLIVNCDSQSVSILHSQTALVANSRKIVQAADDLDRAMKHNGVIYTIDPSIQFLIDDARGIVSAYDTDEARETAAKLEDQFWDAYTFLNDWEGNFEILCSQFSYYKKRVFEAYQNYYVFVEKQRITNNVNMELEQNCKLILHQQLLGKVALTALIDHFERLFRIEQAREEALKTSSSEKH